MANLNSQQYKVALESMLPPMTLVQMSSDDKNQLANQLCVVNGWHEAITGKYRGLLRLYFIRMRRREQYVTKRQER